MATSVLLVLLAAVRSCECSSEVCRSISGPSLEVSLGLATKLKFEGVAESGVTVRRMTGAPKVVVKDYSANVTHSLNGTVLEFKVGACNTATLEPDARVSSVKRSFGMSVFPVTAALALGHDAPIAAMLGGLVMVGGVSASPSCSHFVEVELYTDTTTSTTEVSSTKHDGGNHDDGTLTQALATEYYVSEVIKEIQSFLGTFTGDPNKDAKTGAMLYHLQDAARHSHAGVLDKYKGQKKREISALCGVFDWCNTTGLPQCDMTYTQKTAMHRVLNTIQSEGGYQTMRGIMNSHRIIGEFEEWANAVNNRTFLGEVWQAMSDQKKSVDSVSSQNFWALVDSLGLNTSQMHYMPLAGKYIGAIDEPPPLDTVDRFNETYHGIKWGIWTRAPGFAARLGQFCLFNIALFLENTSSLEYGETFGIRFEGHHYSLSILYQYTQSGYVIQSTPLLVGMFPVQSPPGDAPAHGSGTASTCDRGEYEYQAKWTEGQTIMRQAIKYFHHVIESLPQKTIEQIHIPADTFLSDHPFQGKGIPNEYQFMVSSQGNLTEEFVHSALEAFPHAFIPVMNLSTRTKWAMLSAFRYYTSMMAPEVASGYVARIAKALGDRNEEVLLSYSGDAPFDPEGHFFILIEIDHLLIELTLSPEWSLSVRPKNGQGEPISNHIHSLMRDLRNQWSRDPLAEHLAMHH